jgi:hypothetical protein
MPMTSDQVAAMIAQNQSAFAHQSMQADIVSESLRRAQDPQYGAPAMAGKGMNLLGSVGAPLGGMALGLMGLDPVGLGHKAFGAGRTLGMGYMASGGLALGAFAGATAGMMGLAYVGNQVMSGASQQQQFLNGMQGAFNFVTPTQTGFSNAQLGVMGGALRQMSGQIGPQGQMVGFEELSSLAQNMGRMGLTTGTQDVTTFTQSFRKMLDTVKHVAKEMGTSLKEAQEVMSGLRSSGVFRAADQGRMASEMRSFSVAGGLSTVELSQAAGIGSQVSRSIGGRGSAGAFAGVRTLGQVGLALQSGVMSEEDIYNTTGLRGAEGRQAFASYQLQGAGAWLRSGRGRRFVASLAGEDGTLSEESVRNWQSGGVGTGETMGMAGKNLSAVGRANFLRNEGRLRGEALAAFGGNLPAMALQQWAQSRGVDINDMDDRSMLFAQRQLGMDRGMIDNSIKMLNAMPEMMRQARYGASSDRNRQDIAELRRTSGLEGTKRKMEEAREHLQSKLQSVGQQMYTDLVKEIDTVLQEKSGVILRNATAEIDRTYEGLRKGQGGAMARSLFGVGASPVKGMVGGNTGVSAMTSEQFQKSFLFSDSIEDKMRKSGFGGLFQKTSRGEESTYVDPVTGEVRTAGGTKQYSDADVAAGMARSTAFSRGALMGGDSTSVAAGKGARDALRAIYEGGAAKLSGEDRRAYVANKLKEQGMDALAESLGVNPGDSESYGKAAARLAGLETGANIDEEKRLAQMSQLPAGVGLVGGGDTEAQAMRKAGGGGRGYTRSMAQSFFGYKPGAGTGENIARVVGTTILNSMTAGGYGAVQAARSAADASSANAAADAEGARVLSLDGMQESSGILEGRDMTGAIRSRMKGMKEGSAAYQRQQRLLDLNRRTMAAARSGENVDLKGFEDIAGDLVNAVNGQQAVNRRVAASTAARDATKSIGEMRSLGLVDENGNVQNAFAASVGEKGAAALKAQLALLQHEGKGGSSREDFERAGALGKERFNALLAMSPEELRKSGRAKMAAGASGEEEMALAADIQRTQRSLGRGTTGMASSLGIRLSREEMRQVHGMKYGSGALNAFLGRKLGLDPARDEAARKQDEEQIASEKNQIQADVRNNKIGQEQADLLLGKLEERRKSLNTDDSLRAKLQAATAAGLSNEERTRKLKEMEADPKYQKMAKERREAQDKNPAKHLDKISNEVIQIRTAMADLPSRIAVAMQTSGPPGTPTTKKL